MELMIVIIVVGVLTAVALPQFLGVRGKATANAEIAEITGLAKECAAAISIQGPYPDAYANQGLSTSSTPSVSADCNGGSKSTAPTANIIFKTSGITDSDLDNTIECGPKDKLVSTGNKACQITVNYQTGVIVFAAVP